VEVNSKVKMRQPIKRYCSKCGKILNAAILGDTCLTCLCGLDKRDTENREGDKDE
jgi:hypothetical protein